MFSTTQKIVIGLAMPVLVPLGVVAGMFVLPVAGVRAIRAKLQEMRLLNEYRQNKPETLAVMTDEILESFLEKNNLGKLIQTQLQVVTKSLDRMIKSIPTIIEADRLMIDRLQQERVASEVSLAEKYIPYYQRCLELLGKLDYFYVANIRQYDAAFSDITCDPSLPPIASGTFGDVYAARWCYGDGTDKECAIKIWREHVDEKNVSDILTEEDNLR
jgi:dimethylaniline monooxygenase (N-oxide forming)